MYYSVLGNF